MKQDTIARIGEYNKRLPRLKERLTAALILLLVAVMMLTTVSFAWLSLSVNPEVTGVTTSITSNGNLEIALASGTLASLTAPNESALGDGNKDLINGNITWGNLINLSDPAYGLSNLVLRPAGLNKDDLLGNPLYGADYDATGKHEGYINSFRYAKWQSTDPDDPNAPWEFKITNELGVRAISSTIIAESNAYQYGYQLALDEAMAANREAQEAYLNITKNYDVVTSSEKPFLESLAYIMGAYMTANMNAGQEDSEHLVNATLEKAQMETFRDLFLAFSKALELEREAMRKLANLQLYVLNNGDETKYTEYATVEAFIADKANFASKGLQISGLEQNLADAAKLEAGYEDLNEICQKGEIKWGDDGIADIVNQFLVVGTCTVNGTLVKNIGASAALELNNKTCNTVITNGIIYNFEQRTGARMDVPNGTTALQEKYPKGLTVKARGKRYGMEMSGTIYAKITTNAPTPSQFQQDINYAKDNNTGGVAELTANDTYGFAIDFWIRTNASGSYLKLEGNILTETIEQDAKGVDKDGNEVQLYTVTITQTDDATGESSEYSFDVYQAADEKWYYADTHEEYTVDNNNEPVKKVNIIENVIGYEGDNRIWDNNAFLSTDSTTQGNGSCYVYYADTPEDKERSLKLLASMNVAFVDAAGNLLAEGYMDTEHYFEDNGKITVPMVLKEDSKIKLQNPDGSETLAITYLEKNVATFISAIVYLDGTKIQNEDVLAAADIQGQMNIQFGSTVDLVPMNDEKLASEYLSISASASATEFDYDVAKANNQPMTTTITLDVSGSEPSNITAFFIRSISSTQGIPLRGEGEMLNFTQDPSEAGTWTASHTFDAPGTYILRSVWVDGIEYDFEPDDRPTIRIAGFTVASLSWAGSLNNQKEKDFLTAETSVSDDLYLTFVTDDPARMPSKVEARFMRTDGNSVNVPFTQNPDHTWSGKVTFLSSGEYTLQYLVLNGDYYEVEEAMQKIAKVNLGMKAAVYTNSPVNFLFGYGLDEEPGMEDNEENLYMQVKIMDDTGKEMTALDNVKLYYALEGYNTPVNGLDANLEWNQSTGYYEGEFQSKPGEYGFLYVTVGDNVITTATTSPTFVITSPNPPEYQGHNTAAHQYAPNPSDTPAIITVYLLNSEGIVADNVKGIISDGTTDYEVTPVNAGEDGWQFTIPITNGAQDGTWTLKEIRIAGVFDKDTGGFSTAENPFIIDNPDITTTVVSQINISFANESVDLNGNAFLEEQTLNSNNYGKIEISSPYYDTLPDDIFNGFELIYEYDNNTSKDYGGYQVQGVNTQKVTISLVKQSDGSYIIDGTYNLKYAGEYNLTSITFKFGGTSKSLNNIPEHMLTVETPAPTVTISNISNKDTAISVDATTAESIRDTVTKSNETKNTHWLWGTWYTYDWTWTINSAHITKTPTIYNNGLTADVYFKCFHSNDATYPGGTQTQSAENERYHGYSNNGQSSNPSVAINLSNLKNFTSATLNFSDNTRIYSNITITDVDWFIAAYTNRTIETTNVAGYSWTSVGDCSRYIGYSWNKESRVSDVIIEPGKKIPAGTITANTLTVVGSDDKTYTFTIPTITINNPY